MKPIYVQNLKRWLTRARARVAKRHDSQPKLEVSKK